MIQFEFGTFNDYIPRKSFFGNRIVFGYINNYKTSCTILKVVILLRNTYYLRLECVRNCIKIIDELC